MGRLQLPPGFPKGMMPMGQQAIQVASPMNDVQVIATLAAQLTVYDEVEKNVQLAAGLLAEAVYFVESGQFAALLNNARERAKKVLTDNPDGVATLPEDDGGTQLS